MDDLDKYIETEQNKQDAINEAYSQYKNIGKQTQPVAAGQKTIDTSELYDQIALQTGESKSKFYEKHTAGWEREVEK